MAKRRLQFPCWILSLLIAAPTLVGVSLPPEQPVTSATFSPYGCSPRPWSTLTFTEKFQMTVAPLFARRHFDFAPRRPPFPLVV